MLSLFCQRSVQERPLITFARFKTCEAQGRRNLSLDGKRLYSFGSVLVKASSTKKMGENGRAWIILASRASMCFKSRVVRIADLQVRLETISVPNVHVHMIYTFAGTVWVCRTNLTGRKGCRGRLESLSLLLLSHLHRTLLWQTRKRFLALSL